MAPSLLVVVLLPLQGCGLLALTHDKMLGPVSPAGNIHSAVVGDTFVVTDRGVVGTSERDQPMFRPIPPGFPRRYAEPGNLVKGLRGAQAFVRGISFVVWGESRSGKRLSEDALAGLDPGRGAGDILKELGTPNVWIRRRHGSIMAYKATYGSFLAFYLGMPPLADNISPIPGLGSISLRWHYNIVKPYKTILFFDRDDRLVAWFKNDPDAPIEGQGSE